MLGHNGTITCPRNDLASNRLTKEGVAVHDYKVNMRKYVWPDSSCSISNEANLGIHAAALTIRADNQLANDLSLLKHPKSID